MKTLLIALTTLSAFAANAQTATTYECSGSKDGAALEINFYQGYGYDATYAYFLDGKLQSSGYSHGGSFTECGSRNIDCHMITVTSFSVDDPSLGFSMITSAGSPTGMGHLSIYENGFAAGATAKVGMSCKIAGQLE